MSKQRLPRGVGRYIREEKARIRKTAANPAESERLIAEMLVRFAQYRHEGKRGA